MSVVNVFVTGATGRMGQEVIDAIASDPNFAFVGGMSQGVVDDIMLSPQVVVDFSLPQAMNDVIALCERFRVPLVSGTTGLQPEQKSLLMRLSKNQPVFWSSNMSFGIFVMNELIKGLSPFKNAFTFEISETHHRHKVDTPSGTALLLESSAKSAGLPLEPTKSRRDGDVFGIHIFKINGADETIEIRHEAHNRRLFARGALKIAQWAANQKPGFYGMADYFARPN